jgi:hypothetical protein
VLTGATGSATTAVGAVVAVAVSPYWLLAVTARVI